MNHLAWKLICGEWGWQRPCPAPFSPCFPFSPSCSQPVGLIQLVRVWALDHSMEGLRPPARTPTYQTTWALLSHTGLAVVR